jgi:hypothetical protein
LIVADPFDGLLGRTQFLAARGRHE